MGSRPVRRSRKRGRRGRYRCPRCGKAQASLTKLLTHKKQLRHWSIADLVGEKMGWV